MKRLLQVAPLVIIALVIWILVLTITSPSTPTSALPTPFIVRSGTGVNPEIVATSVSATLPEKTIPPPVIHSLGDETALRTALETIKLLKYENFKSIDMLKAGGAATVSQNRYGITDFNGNPMPYNTFTMTYQSAYVVQIHAGTDDTLFWSTASVTVDNWQEETAIDPSTGGQIITRTAEATVNFILPICVTSIEKVEGESITYQTERPSDEALWLLAKLERDFIPEQIINNVEAAARADALRSEHVSELYNAVSIAASPDGQFYNWLKSIVFAQKFGFREVHLTITIDANQKVRCDGQPIK